MGINNHREFSIQRAVTSLIVAGLGSYLMYRYGYQKPWQTEIVFVVTSVYFFYKIKQRRIYSSSNEFFMIMFLMMLWGDLLLRMLSTGHIDKYMHYKLIESIFIPLLLCVLFCLFLFGISIPKRYHYIPIDYYQLEDTEWRDELIRSARKKHYIAFSSQGADVAKRKAKVLGIADCFVDFMSKDDVEKERGF